MVRFGNKPYVDVKSSFNSLIPKSINKKLRQKLIKYYLKKLSKYPYLHDKIEFEIMFSCYDFNIDKRLNELKKNGFSESEIKSIKLSLIDFTNQIISKFLIIIIIQITNIKNTKNYFFSSIAIMISLEL